MRRILLALLLCVATTAGAADVTVDDIAGMAEAGVSEDILLETVRGKKLTLGADDLAKLRKAGVSERVIAELRANAVPAAGGNTGAEAARDEEKQRIAAEEERRRAAEEQEKERLRKEAEGLRGGKLDAKDVAADVDALIDRGYDQLGDKDWIAAATTLDRVVTGGLAAPNSVRFVEASYGLALALTRAGLPSAAAPHLVSVLKHGPAAPHWGEAVVLLAAWAPTVDWTHPVLEVLDGFEAPEGPVADAHAFLVGSYRARFGDWERARARLSSVDAKGGRGAAAAYRLGLVEMGAGRPREGLAAFEQAVERAEARGDIDTRDLAYLALARIAYEVGRFDAAADYYRRIAPRSAARARARHELVWTLLLAGDDLGALAALAAVDSARYADLVAPDLGVVEATIYLDLCRWDEARARADAFVAEVAPLLAWLEGVTDKPAAEAWKAALAHPIGKKVVHGDIDVHVAAAAAEAVIAEEKKAARFDRDLAARLAKDLAARRKSLEEQAATLALRRLRAFRLEVAELAINADEVKVEASFGERESEYDEKKRPRAVKETRPRLADDESWWSLDDERWLDEEDAYVTQRKSACPE